MLRSRVPLAQRAQFGSSAVLLGSEAVFGLTNADARESEPRRLLTVDAVAQPEIVAPAAWNVSLVSRVELGFPAPGVPKELVPVRARINLGAGGASVPIVVDAWPSMSVPVAAPSFTVDVFWALPAQSAGGLAGFVLPERIRVTAVAHPASLPGRSARLTQFLSANGAVTQYLVPVPPLAIGVAIRALATDQPFAAGSSIVCVGGSTPGAAIVLSSQTGAQHLATIDGGNFYPLPSQATNVLLTLAAPVVQPFALEFELGF